VLVQELERVQEQAREPEPVLGLEQAQGQALELHKRANSELATTPTVSTIFSFST